MASLLLGLVRGVLRVLPAGPRERLAARLFLIRRVAKEPEREVVWRRRGVDVVVGGCEAVSFGDEGRPVALLVHGWEGRGLQLAAFVEPLLEKGFRVVAVDLPGHGRTSGKVVGLPVLAAAMEDVLRALSPVCVVAHSIGASAALVAANRQAFGGCMVCIAGPPETLPIFRRARAMLGLPEDGMERFVSNLKPFFAQYMWEDLFDIEGCARSWGGRVMGVLVRDDEEFPVEESKTIITAAGGECVVLDSVNHRDILWRPEGVEAVLSALDGLMVAA